MKSVSLVMASLEACTNVSTDLMVVSTQSRSPKRQSPVVLMSRYQKGEGDGIFVQEK